MITTGNEIIDLELSQTEEVKLLYKEKASKYIVYFDEKYESKFIINNNSSLHLYLTNFINSITSNQIKDSEPYIYYNNNEFTNNNYSKLIDLNNDSLNNFKLLSNSK
jgi:hypothetical protein